MTNQISAAARGPQGLKGDPGAGIIPGGSAAQLLGKINGTDFNTEWYSLVAGANTTITNDGAGNLTISSSGAPTGIINSANYPNLTAAIAAAYNGGTGTQPLLINNATIAADQVFGGVTTLPGSVATSTIAIDNPTMNINQSNTFLNGLTLNALVNGTALQLATANTNNISFVNSYINCTHYGYLQNDATYNGRIVGFNYINAGFDGVNSNNPTGPGNNFCVIGNIIDTGGFGIAIAQVNGYTMMGNHIRTATNTSTTVAALHVEDLNTGGVVVGNHALNCKGEGFSMQVPITSKGTPDPIVSGFNQIKYTGVAKNTNGVVWINDGNGGYTQGNSIGTLVNGFATGVVISDTQNVSLEGMIVNNCNTAVFTAKHGVGDGKISCKGTTSLYLGQSGSMFSGGFMCVGIAPTTWVVKSGGNGPGPIISPTTQVSVPVTIASGTGAQTVICGPMPTGSKFDCILRMTIEGGSSVLYQGRYHYDGTTLTQMYGTDSTGGTRIALDSIEAVTGTITAGTSSFSVTAGNLVYNFTTTGAITQTGRLDVLGTISQT